MIEGRANELPDYKIFTAIFYYCFVIITIPISSFFIVKVFIFDALLQLEPISSNVYSAIIAILILHITLGLYIYRAYSEAERVKQSKKD